jgi:hypothetical protein
MRSRLALGLAVALAACSGGGSSNAPSVPSLPWGNFRHDQTNSAASGAVNNNKGNVTLMSDLGGGVTLSTPTIDKNGNLLIGTANGVTSFDPDCVAPSSPDAPPPAGCPRWTFTQCDLPCDGAVCPSIPVGRVSASPTVTPGNDIVFGTEASEAGPGALFVVQQRNDNVECRFFYRPDDADSTFSIRSSAIGLVDARDLSLLTVYFAADDGRLRALNSDGSLRWSVPTGAVAGPITNSPALDSNANVYVISADGVASGVDFSGRQLPWTFGVGIPPVQTFQPSPAVGTTTLFAIGLDGALFGINTTGTQKWPQFAPPNGLPIMGSPSFLVQNFDFMANSVLDTIIYVVDQQGTVYGVRDLDGSIIQIQRCTRNPLESEDCRTDSCLPNGGTCTGNPKRCSVSGLDCTQDSCVAENPANDNHCSVTTGSVQVAGEAVALSASPIVSSDLYTLIGTQDGRVCARTLDNLVPGHDFTPPTATWQDGNGCITVGDGSPIVSSPIIGQGQKIYVTTEAGLYLIK